MSFSLAPRRAAVAMLVVLSLGSAALLTLAPLPALAAPAAAAQGEFDAAWQQFIRASRGDKDAIDGAVQAFATLSTGQPADPVLRAYAGAATTMRANTTLLPWRKMSHVEDGLALLDQALAALQPAHDAPAWRGVPGSLEARFVAANTFLSLPKMFNRHERGARLLEEVTRSPLLAGAPETFRATVRERAAQSTAKAAP